MTDHDCPAMIDLFNTYTAGPGSIGHNLAATMGRATANDPLLVATSTDLAFYPGQGAAPTVLGFRMSTRGFKELAGISHLGPALATLVALRIAEPDGVWRADAERLLVEVLRSRADNSVALWQDVIQVAAYRGRAQAIAAMVDYALAVTARYLQKVLADPGYLCYETLRTDYLDDGSRADLPVSFNRIMIATFFLVGMDISTRIIDWLDAQQVDWTRAMVLIAGKQGRPTAGVTWRTNSVAGMVLAASRGALALDRLYIAPHAPTFATPRGGDLSEVCELEPALRGLWAGTRAVVNLGRHMFPEYPAFRPDTGLAGGVQGDTVSEMPAIAGNRDWQAMVTRLRMVMEDPRQLLSGAVSDYAAQQLALNGNDPSVLFVPGLDDEPYPTFRRNSEPSK